MARNIFAIIAGSILRMVLNMGLIQLNMQVLFPPPTGMDMNDPEELSTFIATLPTTAFVVVLLAHLG